MLRKVARGIRATLQGGTKYERSIRKVLKNDESLPIEKHIARIVKALSEQDEETTIAKAEELLLSKFTEASNSNNSHLLQLKLLFLLD